MPPVRCGRGLLPRCRRRHRRRFPQLRRSLLCRMLRRTAFRLAAGCRALSAPHCRRQLRDPCSRRRVGHRTLRLHIHQKGQQARRDLNPGRPAFVAHPQRVWWQSQATEQRARKLDVVTVGGASIAQLSGEYGRVRWPPQPREGGDLQLTAALQLLGELERRQRARRRDARAHVRRVEDVGQHLEVRLHTLQGEQGRVRGVGMWECGVRGVAESWASHSG